MTDTCAKHSFETAVGVCRQCQNSYCAECLIFPFGEKKPPYCVTCALNASGVRRHGAAVNPRLRKKGLFGRKVLVEEAPRKELGFDDVHIGLPDELFTAPAEVQVTRREVSPEVLAMVQAAEADYDAAATADVGGVALAARPDGAGDSLADWAASLSDEPRPAPEPATQPWPETRNTNEPSSSTASTSSDAWPDDFGRTY